MCKSAGRRGTEARLHARTAALAERDERGFERLRPGRVERTADSAGMFELGAQGAQHARRCLPCPGDHAPCVVLALGVDFRADPQPV